MDGNSAKTLVALFHDEWPATVLWRKLGTIESSWHNRSSFGHELASPGKKLTAASQFRLCQSVRLRRPHCYALRELSHIAIAGSWERSFTYKYVDYHVVRTNDIYVRIMLEFFLRRSSLRCRVKRWTKPRQPSALLSLTMFCKWFRALHERRTFRNGLYLAIGELWKQICCILFVYIPISCQSSATIYHLSIQRNFHVTD
jgi:hypothetical protein